MTDDVARKAKSSSDYYNGSKIIYRPNNLTKYRKDAVLNQTASVDDIETAYTDRFDDVRYYTGDSASGT